MLKQLTYQEKVDGEFAPYTIVERFEDIEQELWNDGLKNALIGGPFVPISDILLV